MFTEAYPPQHIARSEKSTVSRTFRDLGCLIIDSNLLAREVVEPRGWPRTIIMAKFEAD